MIWLLIFILLWPFCAVVLCEFFYRGTHRSVVVSCFLLLGYLAGVLFETKYSIIARQSAIVYYPDVADTLFHFNVQHISLLAAFIVILSGGLLAGSIAKHQGKSFIKWSALGLIANFSALLLLFWRPDQRNS